MRRRTGLFAAGIAGVIIGALIVLALPVPGSRKVATDKPPDVRAVEIGTMLVWTPSRIPSELPHRISRLRSVEGVTVVRSGVAWLDAWGERGSIPGSAPDGYAIPVEVAAVDASDYRSFVPPADRRAIAGLANGGALLGESSAELRGLDIGGRLRFGTRRLTIEGVLDDTLIGAHEVVVDTEEGLRLGIERPRYVLVEPREGVDAARVEVAIRRSVPSGARVRVRRVGETPVFRHGDAVLPQVRVKEIFGEFPARPRGDGTLDVLDAWERRNIETADVPVLGQIRCHRLVIPLIRAALEDLVSRGLGKLVNPSDFGGCYYPRYIASDAGTGISHHSWGIAIDLNVSEGLPGRQPTLDRRVVDAFERQGFIWGGRFLIPDGTHFEFQRFP